MNGFLSVAARVCGVKGPAWIGGGGRHAAQDETGLVHSRHVT